ncbi:cysteine hydrolase [Opitutaceae bacterium TAV4]|nr:cysteine hydrolase [Opitutaceae bacterium TAV4]RRJ98724.1 cysteine hydrolase [Opitutaceae bacterium TAV3]
MNPAKTALLLIEFQNDFTTAGGVLHDAVKDVINSTGMLANATKTIAAARAAGATIIFSPISFAKGYHEISPKPYGILKGVVDTQAFIKGTWGADFTDTPAAGPGNTGGTLKPQDSDIVIEGKRGLDAFASTNLDFILRSRGITDLAVCGFLTNCCVESTMRTGYERGYQMVTLTDCCAATSQAEHDAAIRYTFPMFSRPLTHDAFLAELSGSNATADTSRGY